MQSRWIYPGYSFLQEYLPNGNYGIITQPFLWSHFDRMEAGIDFSFTQFFPSPSPSFLDAILRPTFRYLFPLPSIQFELNDLKESNVILANNF